MGQRVGIRFQRAGPIHYFDPAGHPLRMGDAVVAETEAGLSLGRVVVLPQAREDIRQPPKPVLRMASPEDLERRADSRRREETALALARERAAQAGLAIKLLAAESNLEASRITIFFAAEKRVDFRHLLRELGSELQTKVELRQVGARDRARLLSGLGRCGRPLCCASHLGSLESVSMKMAKEQNLPLNPVKLSGVCGRLLCCLAYEVALYRQWKEMSQKAEASASQSQAAPNSRPETLASNASQGNEKQGIGL